MNKKPSERVFTDTEKKAIDDMVEVIIKGKMGIVFSTLVQIQLMLARENNTYDYKTKMEICSRYSTMMNSILDGVTDGLNPQSEKSPIH
jgi:hypothetical protein